MSFTNLITIAIPCFERKEYFMTALESALNQTVHCSVIVVDNCSSHDYFEMICKEKKVTYYRNEKNLGLYPNYNMCYSLANTEYVKILDDDDLLLPNYVESFLNALKKHPDIDVFYTDYYLLESGFKLPHNEILPFGYIEKGYEIIEYGIKYRLAFPYMTSAIKKEKAILDLDINDCIGGYDYVWVYSKADQLTFYGDSQKLHHYRMHKDKTSHINIEWSANTLTAPYIYDTILQSKISEPKLKKKISMNIFWGMVLLKSEGQKSELKKIINSENRFGKYFIIKLRDSILLRILFIMPKGVVFPIYKVLRKIGNIR